MRNLIRNGCDRLRRRVAARTGGRRSLRAGVRWALLLLLAASLPGCSTRAPAPAPKIYRETEPLKPGSYQLQLLLDGRGTFEEFLRRERERNTALQGLDLPGLMRVLRIAFPQLYLPVQPGVPLCNLETSFTYCRGIELLADVEIYGDRTILVHSAVHYRITLRLSGEQPNFFRAAKAMRDRGDFALPRHYYVGQLVEAIQKALPVLREIATDYRKYIRGDEQAIEIELTLEESPEKASARQSEKDLKDTTDVGSGALISVLPNISFLTGLTISALRSGGKTFWEVLKEKKEFELYRQTLDLGQVRFSYAESATNHFSHLLLRSGEPPSAVLIREIIIRLREREPVT